MFFCKKCRELELNPGHHCPANHKTTTSTNKVSYIKMKIYHQLFLSRLWQLSYDPLYGNCFTFNSYSNQDDFIVPRVAKMTGRKYGKFHFMAGLL